jgi:hypothetical protein
MTALRVGVQPIDARSDAIRASRTGVPGVCRGVSILTGCDSQSCELSTETRLLSIGSRDDWLPHPASAASSRDAPASAHGNDRRVNASRCYFNSAEVFPSSWRATIRSWIC